MVPWLFPLVLIAWLALRSLAGKLDRTAPHIQSSPPTGCAAIDGDTGCPRAPSQSPPLLLLHWPGTAIPAASLGTCVVASGFSQAPTPTAVALAECRCVGGATRHMRSSQQSDRDTLRPSRPAAFPVGGPI